MEFQWIESDLDGQIVSLEYSKFLVSGEELDWKRLLEYNQDDVVRANRAILEGVLSAEERKW